MPKISLSGRNSMQYGTSASIVKVNSNVREKYYFHVIRPYQGGRSFPGTFAATLIFTHFIVLYDQKLENRLGFVLSNLVVQPCPLMSDERYSTNDHPDTADCHIFTKNNYRILTGSWKL